MTERIIYEIEVPQSDRKSVNDTPDAYRVVECEGVPTCMVYGLYSRFREQPEWVANPATRWIVNHLLGRLAEMERLERALRDIAAVIVPPADTIGERNNQRVIYNLRSIALKALGEQELP